MPGNSRGRENLWSGRSQDPSVQNIEEVEKSLISLEVISNSTLPLAGVASCTLAIIQLAEVRIHSSHLVGKRGSLRVLLVE